MKLSDIGELGKLVEEYRQVRGFLSSIQHSKISKLQVNFTNAVGVESNFNLNHRNTEPETFMKDLVAVVLERHNLLRTKLALMGVDDFEDNKK